LIGTLFYYAIGYNVVDTYIVNVDPKRVKLAETARTRDASGRVSSSGRISTRFSGGKPNPDGTYRMTASRFVEASTREFQTLWDEARRSQRHLSA
jgi:hypothetical protein